MGKEQTNGFQKLGKFVKSPHEMIKAEALLMHMDHFVLLNKIPMTFHCCYGIN